MPKKNLYRLVLWIALAGFSWILLNHFLLKSSLPQWNICWFRQVTGIPCPSCGTTHSVLSIAKGDFRQALHENVLGFPAILMLVIFPLWILTDRVLGKESFFHFYSWCESLLRKKYVAWSAFLLLMIYWGWNIFRTW
jgi:hypothetical protein